ncbi:DUF5627 domain-containing protein [uncultured Bacteroides sp.]|uniref:DUF5627 domain-containing protein n=1 Tax=uncultured Bacteroides sp. TaxID=162156 RepID=UPI002618203E|nr:DUF5627 domain-containing protein [uncultured Bacteroides sp.]
MKLNKILPLLALGTASLTFTSCENGDSVFSDYEGGTSVYFAYQYPVRTLVLGNDEYNNERDNAHKCAIYSTMGGAYSGRNITLDIKVDNSLCDNLYFENGSPVLPMPSEYYSLLGNQIKYNGELTGFVEVQFTDAYFNDPKAITNNYVIPVVITGQTGADRILSGTPLIEGDTPSRTNAALWSVAPKDYVLYCVKYKNPWDAFYLRRGKDVISEGGVTSEVVRHGASVEKDEVCSIGTRSLTTAVFPVTTADNSGNAVTCDLLLNFNGDECTVTSGTDGISISGSGKFVENGEKKAWGNKDRDAIYLDYTISMGSKTIATKDTLVLQTRGTNKLEVFTPKYVEN